MSERVPQSEARRLSPSPKYKVSHSSRAIKYVFLDGCKNISASHTLDSAGTQKVYKGSVSCHPKVKHNTSTAADFCRPRPKHIPTFSTLPMHLEEQDEGSRQFLPSKKRLPVFQQLCGEAVPGMALGDIHPQNSSQELKELPDTKASKADKKGQRMRHAAERSPCNNA